MIREWLLVIWLGTTTNFTLGGVFWSLEQCIQARDETLRTVTSDFQVVCTQDMREGRSAYAPRPGAQGLVK